MKKTVFLTLVLFSATCFAQDSASAFKKNCALCHGADGHATGPMAKNIGAVDLTSAKVKKTPDAELKTIISKGKGKMPPYGTGLGARGVDDMVKYIRALK